MSDAIFSIFPNEQFVDLSLYQYGYEACTPLHSYGPYIRNHYLFHYIISGKGTLLSTYNNNTRTYELEANQGFLITPGYVNTYFADKETPWEYTWIEFDGIKAKEYLETSGLTAQSPVYSPITCQQGRLLLDEMLYIANHPQASALNLMGHLYLFLDQLMQSSVRKKKIQGGRLRDFYIREAIEFIEQNYTFAITVDDMARGCNLNRSYFGKIFKEVTGQSPQDFLIHYRMAKGAERLKLTNEPIKAISTSVGYENQLHFSRAFKKVYGISPREYRQQNQIKN